MTVNESSSWCMKNMMYLEVPRGEAIFILMCINLNYKNNSHKIAFSEYFYFSWLLYKLWSWLFCSPSPNDHMNYCHYFVYFTIVVLRCHWCQMLLFSSLKLLGQNERNFTGWPWWTSTEFVTFCACWSHIQHGFQTDWCNLIFWV